MPANEFYNLQGENEDFWKEYAISGEEVGKVQGLTVELCVAQGFQDRLATEQG